MSEMQIEKIIKHGYKEIYVIGHSMGGVIAAYLASKYKEVKKTSTCRSCLSIF